MSWINSLTLVACTLWVLSGCGSLTLKHTPLPAVASPPMAVGLTVFDRRPAHEGGDNAKQVGTTRSLVGIPYAVEAENEVRPAIEALFADALRSTGVNVARGSAVQVQVDVMHFFMFGYMGYKIETVFVVRAHRNGTVLFQSTLAKNHGFSHATDADMYQAFDEIMDMIAADAVKMFASSEFRTALAGQASR